MATTVTPGRPRLNQGTISVPYVVTNEVADGVLWGYVAENAVASRVLLDYGVLPFEFSADQLSEHAWEYFLQLDRTQVYSFEEYLAGGSSGTYTPPVSWQTETHVLPPQPVYRKLALATLQKETGGAAIGDEAPDTLSLDKDGKSVVITPPAESDRIEATFPTAALASTFRTAMRSCMHKLNDDTFFGHPAGCVMLLRAGATREIGGLARVSMGFAIGSARTVMVGEELGGVELTGVLPFSRVTAMLTEAPIDFFGETIMLANPLAVYEHEVFERADYSALGIPYP